MDRIPFDPKELEFSGNPMAPFHYPITPGKNWIETMHHRTPLWMGFCFDASTFTPRIHVDNVARALVRDGGPEIEFTEADDMFGIPWVYVPVATGSMEKEGAYTKIDDMNDFAEFFSYPNVDEWDWDAQTEMSKNYCVADGPTAICLMIQNGFFERLISFMGFEDAVVAMIDEDQEDAIHDCFDHLSDIYIQIIDHTIAHGLHIDGVEVHDDWGSQMAPFFAADVARDMVAPYIKKISDHVHSLGLYYMMHCCGNATPMVPVMIDAGVDSWYPQDNANDVSFLYKEYGKDIVLGVSLPEVDMDAPEEQVREIAEAFADEFIHPEAPVYKSLYSPMMNNRLLDPMIYELSRKKYCS